VTYIDFVQTVARSAADATADYSARVVGVWETQVLARVGIPSSDVPEFHGSASHLAFIYAIEDLSHLGVVRLDGNRILVSDDGRAVAVDLQSLWPSFFATRIDAEQAAFLGALVATSLDNPDAIGPRIVKVEEVFERLVWENDPMKVLFLFNSLKERNFLSGVLAAGPYIHRLRPTYAGTVRATQEEPTAVRQRIQSLLPDWETASVEFKLTLSLDRDADKAEFAKDVCALATTKTGDGQRFLVVGFHPKIHTFGQSLDARVTQDRAEQILNAHTTGAPPIRLYRAQWEGGTVGAVVVARNAENVPYRLRPETAAKFFGGRDVFVRHGSQVESPTPGELASLIAEAEAARSRT
jgi:hypothetical protein